MLPVLVGLWFVCAIVGSIIGSGKNAAGTGALLGMLFGPLGVIAAFAIDGRLTCSHCGWRLNGTPNVCPQCHTEVGRQALSDPPDAAFESAEAAYVRRLRDKRGGKSV